MAYNICGVICGVMMHEKRDKVHSQHPGTRLLLLFFLPLAGVILEAGEFYYPLRLPPIMNKSAFPWDA
jgi:hypothetical protein